MIINRLTVAYRKNTVLKDLSVEFKHNEINGLVGMNGAGKTTLLRTIFGTLKANSGSIQLQEDSATKPIAFLETENFFYPKIKGGEYLEIFAKKNPSFDSVKWNQLFDLPLNKLIDDYSTGMKKKLALLGVIALDKPIIMLDEPFNGVDLESNEKIKLVLKRLQEKGKTIIVTSHILETLTDICAQITVLFEGKTDYTAFRGDYHNLKAQLNQRITDKASTIIDNIFNDQ
ncbi:MAG: ATP-binding cassette domain-containing protein [Bacteroidia bacterium]